MLAQALAGWSSKTPQPSHPFAFAGVRSTKTVTKQHVPLIWENMLGTVMARDPQTREEKYFDYDWAGAQSFARLSECSDLRSARIDPDPYHTKVYGRRRTRLPLKLYGIPPTTTLACGHTVRVFLDGGEGFCSCIRKLRPRN